MMDIIGNILVYYENTIDDNNVQLMREKALSMFKYDENKTAYVFTVPNPSWFYMVCSMIAGGTSF